MAAPPPQAELFKRIRRLAVLGGTFDPIHNGHLAVAEAALRAYRPQRVVFIPSARPPHKKNADVSAPEHRYQMALLAVAEYPAFDVSRIELDRPGPSFTADTLRALRALCPADAEIFFITGADAVADIPTWKDPGAILSMCVLAAAARPGMEHVRVKKSLARLHARFGGRQLILDAPQLQISGTDIRRLAAEGKPFASAVPMPVARYIKRHGLYRPDSVTGTAGGFDYKVARAELAQRLSRKRYLHTLGVVKTCDSLAARYGLNRAQARAAALLHDCAKEYSPDKKRALCELWRIPPDDIQKRQIDLMHAPLSAESARRDFGVGDADVLNAIRYHTTGRAGMSRLEKAVMLADFIEPCREDYPGLDEMRRLAETSMEAALVFGITETIRLNEARGRLVHPHGREALAELTDY